MFSIAAAVVSIEYLWVLGLEPCLLELQEVKLVH